MADALVTYIQEHLSGARFALTLLDDLSGQEVDSGVSRLATRLKAEIEEDRDTLERSLNELGGDSSTIKEAAAWIAQKAGKWKLSVADPLGVFEAVEFLVLGVTGKKALWTALAEVGREDFPLSHDQLATLIGRADDQIAALEQARLRLAKSALWANPSLTSRD